jgi:hypothetical protein
MSITVNITKAKSMTSKALAAGIVPMLWGPPAIGKSEIVHQIAKENNLILIDERLSDCDPTDLKGFPFIDKEREKGGYYPMEQFPIMGDKIPFLAGTTTPYNGWLLFLDELTNADDDVKKAAYKLILDRMVGQKKLHDNCYIIAAGNDASHGALAGELGTALESRVLHIVIDVEFKSWMSWALDNNIEQPILDYLNFTQGEKLYTFKPDHTDKTFASPRTWAFADKLIKTHGLQDADIYPLLAGVISPGVASEFMQFIRVYSTLPKIDEIIQGPDYMPIPTDLSTLFALCGNISRAMNVSNVAPLMKYVKRMPPEFLVVTMIGAIKREPALKQNSEVRGWAMNNGHELF